MVVGDVCVTMRNREESCRVQMHFGVPRGASAAPHRFQGSTLGSRLALSLSKKAASLAPSPIFHYDAAALSTPHSNPSSPDPSPAHSSSS